MKTNNKMQGGTMKNSFVQRSLFSLLRTSISKNCSLTPISLTPISPQHYSRTNFPGEVRCDRHPRSGFLKRVVLPLRWLTGSLALFVVLTGTAQAGRYELEKGKGVEVCEAYGKNLNSFKTGQPFRVTRPVNPEFKDFSKPVLYDDLEYDFIPGSQQSSDKSIQRLIANIDSFLWKRDINPIYWYRGGLAKWRGTPAQYEEAWKYYKFSKRGPGIQTPNSDMVGEVDIDNDGVPERVYLDRHGEGKGVPLLVLNADHSDLDYAKTKLVMQHPSRKEQGLGELRKLAPGERADAEAEEFGFTPVVDAWHGASYDIFLYKNKTYFDLWWTRHPDYHGDLDFLVGKPLRVFVIENGRTREICTYALQYYK